MKYGYFDDKNREYVITDPKTPYPWINYLGNHDFFSLISNTAGGYAFYKDAKLRRITRYRYNNVPADDGGRYFYIKDGDTVWSPGWKPVKTGLDAYECRHGLSYTRVTGRMNGVEAEVLFLVPLHCKAEVQRVRIRNVNSHAKQIKLFSLVEWALWNAQDDITNFQRNLSTGEVEVDGPVIYHKTEYRERRDHFAFHSVNRPNDGFDTDRESFIGLYNGFDMPQAVAAGKPSNSMAHGWSPIASHYFDMELEPGEERSLIFMLGYVEMPEADKWQSPGVINKSKALEMIARFDTDEKVDRALGELREYWSGKLGKYVLDHPDGRLNRMVNIWNQYQCMVTFNMSRSASYFESGIGRGMGFRDSNQDLIGFVHQVPERARQRILDIAATQFPDGGCYHQFQPLTKRGNHAIGGGFNDDPLWLILGTTAYIKETGDTAILGELVPFDNDESLAKPLFDHLTISFNHVVENLGPHKLPLIGRADWNDCLNLNCFSRNPDESFQTTENKTSGSQAESLMIAGLFVVCGRDYVELCQAVGKHTEARRAQGHVEAMVEAVKEYGWDGDWFLRAFDYYGNKIGSHENEEGQIFVESNGWCAMAGIGKEEGMVERALDSVTEHLDTEYGIVLNHPSFSRYHLELGEISSYPPGYKENGGIFCHNNPWIMIGEAMLGRGDKAFDYYRKIAPAYLEEISDLHRTEPYVYAQMIAGKDAVRPGEAKNSWLTGTAAWNYFAITQYILGIKPHYDGLVIDPCIPEGWEGYSVRRVFRGVTYEIEVRNPAHLSAGVRELIVDGEAVKGNKIPVFEPGSVHSVKVILGRPSSQSTGRLTKVEYGR